MKLNTNTTFLIAAFSDNFKRKEERITFYAAQFEEIRISMAAGGGGKLED
jgi:hypothetical protein